MPELLDTIEITEAQAAIFKKHPTLAPLVEEESAITYHIPVEFRDLIVSLTPAKPAKRTRRVINPPKQYGNEFTLAPPAILREMVAIMRPGSGAMRCLKAVQLSLSPETVYTRAFIKKTIHKGLLADEDRSKRRITWLASDLMRRGVLVPTLQGTLL